MPAALLLLPQTKSKPLSPAVSNAYLDLLRKAAAAASFVLPDPEAPLIAHSALKQSTTSVDLGDAYQLNGLVMVLKYSVYAPAKIVAPSAISVALRSAHCALSVQLCCTVVVLARSNGGTVFSPARFFNCANLSSPAAGAASGAAAASESASGSAWEPVLRELHVPLRERRMGAVLGDGKEEDPPQARHLRLTVHADPEAEADASFAVHAVTFTFTAKGWEGGLGTTLPAGECSRVCPCLTRLLSLFCAAVEDVEPPLWQCSKCSFVNKLDFGACAVCHTTFVDSQRALHKLETKTTQRTPLLGCAVPCSVLA